MVDCLGIDSVVVSSCVVRQGASLEVAEFFCGGFSGWSQAAYILHSHGFPINVAWTIDVDPACSEMLRYQHDPWHEISQLEDLYCTPLQGTVHVCADINTNWWLTLFQTKPVNLVCVCVCLHHASRGLVQVRNKAWNRKTACCFCARQTYWVLLAFRWFSLNRLRIFLCVLTTPQSCKLGRELAIGLHGRPH